MSAWGIPAAGSAWASQVDDEEAENGGELEAPSEKEPVKPAKFTPSARAAAAAGGGGLAPPIDSASAFPSLGESLSIKETKAERKAKKKLSLAEFMAPSSDGGSGGGGYRPLGASSSSLASASTALLPTAPRARVEGEDDDRDGRGQRLGGAFKDGEHRYAAQDSRSRSRERGGFGDRERGERRGGEKEKRERDEREKRRAREGEKERRKKRKQKKLTLSLSRRLFNKKQALTPRTATRRAPPAPSSRATGAARRSLSLRPPTSATVVATAPAAAAAVSAAAAEGAASRRPTAPTATCPPRTATGPRA